MRRALIALVLLASMGFGLHGAMAGGEDTATPTRYVIQRGQGPHFLVVRCDTTSLYAWRELELRMQYLMHNGRARSVYRCVGEAP